MVLTKNQSKMVSDDEGILINCNKVVTPDVATRYLTRQCQKLDCLPKIRKPGNSRSTISVIGSPTYNLVKCLSNKFANLHILQPISMVRNSVEFIKRIKHAKFK